MRVILDTNTLIRYFTRDIPERADLVEKILTTEIGIYIPESVFPEIAYVLKKEYGFSRQGIIAAYNILLNLPYVQLTRETETAIFYFNKYTIDMVDCFAAAHSLKGKLASFDEKLLQIEGVNPYWK